MNGSSNHIFIVGIAGTFMAGLALIARQHGYHVRGCDQNIYPPMSTVLADHKIEVKSGYCVSHLQPDTQTVIIGNVLSRGNPLIEAILDKGLPYISGPQWLAQQILIDRTAIAVAGTHGKTTTASILAWILESAGREAGFLIGGKPGNFVSSARIGRDRLFVIEADEYDTAFFDKRAKFVHYRPQIAILNNLEYDHADIFANLDAIKKQFHHLVRTIPSSGIIIANIDDANIRNLLALGSWSKVVTFSTTSATTANWQAMPLAADCSQFEVRHQNKPVVQISWDLIGAHNMANALAAIAAASAVGIEGAAIGAALTHFKGSDRRLQKRFDHHNIKLFEDFAHHPTAIRATLKALRTSYPDSRLIVVLELRSNSMKMGVHNDALPAALNEADHVLIYQPQQSGCNLANFSTGDTISIYPTVHSIIDTLQSIIQTNDTIVMMSNGSFDQLPQLTLKMLKTLNP